MKIFWMTGDATDIVAVGPDSSEILRANPLFVPDDELWQATLWLAVRVSRLGMKVAPRFASRYYDAVSLVAHPRHCITPTQCEYTRDGAAIRGTDLPVPEGPIAISLTNDAGNGDSDGQSDGDTTLLRIEGDILVRLADTAVATVSLLHTIKTGDLICLPLDISPITPLEPGLTMPLNINGTRALTLKIR